MANLFLSVSVVYAIEILPADVDFKSIAQNTFDIKVKIRPQKVLLGQPVTLVVEGDNLAESIAKIDWSLFTKNFVIDDIDQGSNLLRVRFYPLYTGLVTIQPQNAMGINIPKTEITIEENPEVRLKWHSPQDHGLSQQQMVWKAEVTVANPAYLVEMKARETKSNEEMMVRLLQSNSSNESRKSAVFMASYQMPTVFKAQQMELASPVIEVKNSGNQRWKFFDSNKKLTLKPLPSFLPVSVAVGDVEGQIAPLKSLYQTGSLHYWQWQLIGHGVTGEFLKSTAYDLIGQLEQSDEISWLSESMDVNQSSDEHGILTTLTVQVPYRINKAGLVSLPELVMHWFNPHSGKVEQKTITATSALVLPAWLMWILQWLLLMLALVVLFMSLFIIKQAWYGRKLIKSLDNAQSPLQIWQALQDWKNNQASNKNAMGLSQDTLNSTSIGLWQQWYLKTYDVSATQQQNTTQLVNLLNKALFRKSNTADNKTDKEQLNDVVKAWIDGQSIWPTLSQIKSSLLWFKKLDLNMTVKGK